MAERAASLLPLLLLAAAAPADGGARQARRLFEERSLAGALYAEEVRTGAVAASVPVGDGADGRPLSAVKLLLAAIRLEHRRELGSFAEADLDLLIARGSDDAGRELARDLRRRLGSATMLRDLAGFGFPACGERRSDCTTLSAATPDTEWAEALSLGETDLRVTPAGLSHFLRLVGRSGIGAAAAAQLQRAMRNTVAFGTARGIGDRLGASGRLGGKTGTTGPEPHDGLFAGLVFARDGRPLYTIVTVVRRGGFGGGAAAEISADMAAALLNRRRGG